LDLGKYMDKKITVKFTGGREGEFSLPHFISPVAWCLFGLGLLVCWRCGLVT
jgi:hypothetical protein